MFSHFASYPLLLLFFILYPCLFLFCLINFIHLTHYYTRFTLILLYLLLPFLSSALYFIYSPFHVFTFCFFLYILVFFFFSPFFCFLFLPYIATCLFLCCRFSFINNIESFFHIIKLLSRFNECGVCLYVYVCVCVFVSVCPSSLVHRSPHKTICVGLSSRALLHVWGVMYVVLLRACDDGGEFVYDTFAYTHWHCLLQHCL